MVDEPVETDDDEISSTDDAALMQLIVSMRIYDVLLALLHESNPNKANELLQLHSTGALLASAPAYIGEFLTDKINSTLNN